MTLRIPLLLAATAGFLSIDGTGTAVGQGRDPEFAMRALQRGRFIPLRVIENRIVPRMRGCDYLGPELDVEAGRYRLKFIRGGRVIWIDVDARTGAILGQAGN